MSDEHRCETCRRWGTSIADWLPRRRCAAWGHLSKPDDTCEHYEPAVPFTDDLASSPIERYAAERGLSADEAAMQVVMADHELLDEIAKSGECMRDGKRLLTSDEVFGTDGEEGER